MRSKAPNPDLELNHPETLNPKNLPTLPTQARNWVAVKELKLSYYIGQTLLFTIYTHHGNLI